MLIDEQLVEVSKLEHLLIDRADAASLMTSRQWCRRVDAGVWLPVAPGIWRHQLTTVDWRLQARAGLRCLGREASLYGRTACGWWGLGEIEVEEVEFVVPRSRLGRPFPFTLHTTRHWETRDLLTHIEKVIDAAISRRLTSLPTLRKRVEVLCGKGAAGSALLRALLLDSGGDSYLERRFLELVRRSRLPRPTCQVVHRAAGKRIARVDFQFPGTNVIVEVSGRLGHVSDRDRQRDAHRRNALQASGHIVLEFTTADVLDEQPYVVETLIAQRATRSGGCPTTIWVTFRWWEYFQKPEPGGPEPTGRNLRGWRRGRRW